MSRWGFSFSPRNFYLMRVMEILFPAGEGGIFGLQVVFYSSKVGLRMASRALVHCERGRVEGKNWGFEDGKSADLFFIVRSIRPRVMGFTACMYCRRVFSPWVFGIPVRNLELLDIDDSYPVL